MSEQDSETPAANASGGSAAGEGSESLESSEGQVGHLQPSETDSVTGGANPPGVARLQPAESDYFRKDAGSDSTERTATRDRGGDGD